MNRRGFLKMLGLAVPAKLGRIDRLQMHKWQRVEFDKDRLFGGAPRAIDQAAAWENAGIAIQSIFPVGGR